MFNDETDGHVDNICCFVRPGVVALHWTDDESDPQHAISVDALRAPGGDARDARGRSLEVHRLPMPGPLYDDRRRRPTASTAIARREAARWPATASPASYVNFYIANERHRDAAARRAHRRRGARDPAPACSPSARSSACPAREILLGGGNIHCITQQVPAA